MIYKYKMKFTRFRIFLVVCMLIGLSVSIFSNIFTAEAAFGISPPWVQSDNLLPGTTFEQVVNLSRNDTEEAMKATIKMSGDKDLLKWIEIPDKENLIMKEGQNTLPMNVIINVPKRVAIKNYKGNIVIVLLPIVHDDSLGGGQVAIALGASVDVDITVVGDKVIDYKIVSTSVKPLPEGNAFGLSVEVENLGNVDIEGIKGQIDIYDIKETELIQSLTFPPFRFPIEFYTTQTATMFFKEAKLDPGEYRVIVTIFKDGEVIYENRLYQKIAEKVIPVITPEDAISAKPSLPGSSTVEPDTAPPPVIEVPVTDMRPVAPPLSGAETNSAYLIFGLAGLGLGLVGLIGIIVVLIMVLKNQQRVPQQAMNGPYPMQPQPQPQPQPAPGQPIQNQSAPAPGQPAQNQFIDSSKDSKIDERQ